MLLFVRIIKNLVYFMMNQIVKVMSVKKLATVVIQKVQSVYCALPG